MWHPLPLPVGRKCVVSTLALFNRANSPPRPGPLASASSFATCWCFWASRFRLGIVANCVLDQKPGNDLACIRRFLANPLSEKGVLSLDGLYKEKELLVPKQVRKA